MQHADILIVEDDKALAEALCDTLTLEGYRVAAARNGTDALSLLTRQTFGLILSDVQMPVMDGLTLLDNVRQKYESVPVLLMTAYGTVAKAVDAMRGGAVDYLIKPFEAQTLIDKVSTWLTDPPTRPDEQVVGDERMTRLYELVAKVAKTNVTMLLEGESGTGKEVLARYIHSQSHYRSGPFEAINCAAIPENMLEALLFGHEKGAFTGAVQGMPGKFEQAQGGTLLLDEISEMDLGLQAKLLRVLQEKEVERLGSHRKIVLNVRFLATTNRKLRDYVRQGRFREDLYYRLSVFPVNIPPLRERVGDILPLARRLLRKHGGNASAPPRIAESAEARLLAYRWPGNVRELENVMQRALILHGNGCITVDDLVFEDEVDFQACRARAEAGVKRLLPDTVMLDEDDRSLDDSVRSVETKIILQILEEVGGNRQLTAEKLGISARTLRYKIARMRQAGIAVPV